ncbi:MAG: type II secretion system protein [Lentisphaeria bacterium]
MKRINVFMRFSRSFTMVELLVVIGMIGLLLGIVLPSIPDMMSGGAVGLGASNVKSVLGASKSYAMSKRLYVALICPDDKALAKDNPAVFRSYRAAIVKRPTAKNKPYEFIAWMEGSEWGQLPSTTYLEITKGDVEVIKVDLEALEGNSSVSCIAMVIMPSGRPVVTTGSTTNAEIEVGSGYFDSDRSQLVEGKNSRNKLRVVSDVNTGRIDVRELRGNN